MRAQTHPSFTVHNDAQRVAEAVAGQLIETLAGAQALRGSASVVLTGGRTGIAVLEQVRIAPARDDVEWSAVDFFWGDDRFVGGSHPDRNELQARRALLDHLDVDPGRVHPMEPSDGKFGPDAGISARAYRQLIADHRVEGEPLFDVCLLGVGEDGHVASLFPGLDAVQEQALTALSVHGSPKPPPTRITLTLPALCESREVWLLATGEGKAEAVARVLAGASAFDVPAAGVRGLDRTLWFLDSAAVGTTEE
ncbi:6-phosphogluconolactonase [Nocardioides sp. AN3]